MRRNQVRDRKSHRDDELPLLHMPQDDRGIVRHVRSGALGPLALAMTLQPRIVAYSLLIAAAIGASSGFIPAALATRGDISAELRAV